MRYNSNMCEDHSPEASEAIIKDGMHVTVELVDRSGESETVSFDIVADEFADYENGFLGKGTPLSKAIQGSKPGDEVIYRRGELQIVRILNVESAHSPPPKEVATRRQATIQKAIEASDRTSAMIFASSFSGKWGDYDPSGIEKWEKKEDQSDESQ
jgi:hypothetical protein